ncbi:DUF948 domain-containing protein [Paenibacillus beijingensis]|uniref:DUF948 domain-containing protein n=1 Tax=Paenibacillus beijingensis TaxID=1126833 RepID=UPI0006983652|nr:DUF948 domain-containing protein [Paenibacillus beijingensis]
MLLEISVLIIAIAVAVLVVFLVQTLKKAQASLEAASGAIKEVQSAIKEWKGDVDDLVVSVKDLTKQVNHQIDAVDPLMASVREVGQTVHEVAAAAREFSTGWTMKLRRKAREAAAVADAENRASLSAKNAGAAYAGTAVPVKPGIAATGERPAGVTASPEPAGSASWMEWLDVGVQALKLIRQSKNRA